MWVSPTVCAPAQKTCTAPGASVSVKISEGHLAVDAAVVVSTSVRLFCSPVHPSCWHVGAAIHQRTRNERGSGVEGRDGPAAIAEDIEFGLFQKLPRSVM